MKNRTAAILAILLALGVHARCDAIDRTKKEMAEEVIREAGFEKIIRDAGENYIVTVQAANPRVPKAFWDFQTMDIEQALVKRLLEAHVDAYVEALSEDELKELLGFYRSPLGKRLAVLGQKVTTEKIQKKAGEAYGEFAVELKRRLQKSGTN